MPKEIEHLEFFQEENIELIGSLKNKGTKYLLIFDEPRAEICNSKAFDDNDNAGRSRGLSTIYTKNNSFHPKILG